MSWLKKIGKGLSNLAPKHTIIGKLSRGNVKGAIESTKNYVKSGELLEDIKNVSTLNVGGITNKALFSDKYGGKGIKSIGSGLASLVPSLDTQLITQRANNVKKDALKRASVGETPTISKRSISMPSTGTEQATAIEFETGSTKAKIDNSTLLIIGGAIAIYFYLNK